MQGTLFHPHCLRWRVVGVRGLHAQARADGRRLTHECRFCRTWREPQNLSYRLAPRQGRVPLQSRLDPAARIAQAVDDSPLQHGCDRYAAIAGSTTPMRRATTLGFARGYHTPTFCRFAILSLLVRQNRRVGMYLRLAGDLSRRGRA